MKKVLLALLVTLFLFTAQNVLAADTGWYAGVGFGQSSVDTGVSATTGTASLDEEDSALKVFGGYNFNKYAAIEFQYLDAGEASLTGNTGDTFVSGGTTFVFTANNVKIATEAVSFGVSGVFTYPAHQYFKPFVKIGLHSWELEATASSGVTSSSATTDGTDLLFGLGARADITDKVSLRVEYENLDLDGDDLTVVSGGVVFNF